MEGLIIGRNLAFQNGLGLTIKTASANSPWAYVWEGLLLERFVRLKFGGLIFRRAYFWGRLLSGTVFGIFELQMPNSTRSDYLKCDFRNWLAAITQFKIWLRYNFEEEEGRGRGSDVKYLTHSHLTPCMQNWARVEYLSSLPLDPSVKIVSRPFFLLSNGGRPISKITVKIIRLPLGILT